MPISRILSCWLVVCWILYLASSLDLWDFLLVTLVYATWPVRRVVSVSSPYLLFFFLSGMSPCPWMIPNSELWITFVLISCSLVLLWFVSSAFFFFFCSPPVGCYLIRPLVVFCLFIYLYSENNGYFGIRVWRNAWFVVLLTGWGYWLEYGCHEEWCFYEVSFRVESRLMMSIHCVVKSGKSDLVLLVLFFFFETAESRVVCRKNNRSP